MTIHSRHKRIATIGVAVAILMILMTGSLIAANVISNGTMEAVPLTGWIWNPGTNAGAQSQDTAQKAPGGAYSLKGISAAVRAGSVDWNHSQTIASSVAAGSTASLSFWYGHAATGGTGTASLSVELDNGTPTTIWGPTAVSLTTTFVSPPTVNVTVPASAFPTTGTYTLRLRVTGTTPNVKNGGTIAVWWDDVVLDVTAPAPITTTVGDGTDPANTSICPDTVARVADAFTLQSTRNSSVSAVNVALGDGAAAALSLVEITNDAGTVVYGSVSNPAADSINVPLTTNITSTTTATQYEVRVTPRGHAAPAGSYSIAPRIAGIASDAATVTNNDAGDATLAIDNAPTATAAWGTNSAGDTSVALAWTNPVATDFNQVVILRATGAPVADTPVEGSTYAQDATIGSSTVRYVGPLTSFNDTAVTNGTTYHYRIFAKDNCGNYSAGVASAALTPNAAAQTTTVGNGTDPVASNTCPGGAPQFADAFTLQTTSGTNAVIDVTLNITGAVGALAKVEITDDAGATVYGFVDNPASSPLTVTTSGLNATAALTQYKVRLTPKPHATMPTGDHALSAVVTAISCTNLKQYEDVTGATVSIDNAAPAAATWGTTTAGNAKATLNWTRPAGATDVLILRSTSTPVTVTPADGASYAVGAAIGSAEVRYAGSLLSFVDDPLVNDTPYYYALFTRDACGNYSTGVETGPVTPTDFFPKTTAGTATAQVNSCSQITVSVPHTGDKPANGTTDFQRATARGGPWTDVCMGVSGASPRSCTMTGLTPGTTYYIQVKFNDADGVGGQNPQIAGPLTTPVVCAQASTTAGTATVRTNACRQATVTAPLTGDADNDGWVSVEYNTSNSWPGTTACAKVSGGSPRQCLVSGLNPSTTYWFRTTYSDAGDGVSGTPVQTSSATTPACGTDTAAPAVMFLTPATGAVIGGTEKFRVQVWDAGTLAAVNPVQWSLDGAALKSAVTINSNISCGAGCATYEFQIVTGAAGENLANGPHYVTVQATDSAGNVSAVSRAISVSNTASGKPRGGGTLLRRSHGSQLCVDCHAYSGHSSQTTKSTKYGSWAVDCLTCHTPHKTPNVALIRPQIQTPSSGVMNVQFRTMDRSGGTNPENSLLGTFDNYNDGICEVCHTKTTHHRNDTSGGDHTHYQGQRCSGCHNHVRGFKATSCIDCHNSPPTIGKHRSKHDEVWNSTSGLAPAAYADASSHGTATQYGYACVKCHDGTHESDRTTNPTHDGSATKPWLVEVVFQGKNSGSTYTPGAAYPASTDIGADGSYFSWSNGSCTNGYCHSNAAPLGGTNLPVSVTWNQVAPTTCTSCHKTSAATDGSNDATHLSKTHAKHIQSASSGETSYAFSCDECHAATIRNAPNSPWLLASADLVDKRMHVNETKDVKLSTTLLGTTINQSAATYGLDTSRTCTGSYCHSQGTSTTAPFPPPNVDLVWGQATAAQCDDCHGGNAGSGVPINSNAHAKHVNNATLLGVTFACSTCHAATVTSDTAIATLANHVNGVPNVSGTNVGGWTNPTCASSNCHSSGQRWAGATKQFYLIDWTSGTADCKGCHGRFTPAAFTSVAGEPNYANTSPNFNSHDAHVTTATDCKTCHAATVGTSNRIDGTTPSQHLDMDGTPDVVFSGLSGTPNYNASTRTCTVSCHGAGAPIWGGAAMKCGDCHLGAADLDNWNITDGVVSIINSTEWTSSGHGTAAIALPGTNPCVYCHTTAVGHKDVANPFRLANTGGADGANGTCLICHKTGSAGYNPGAGLKNGAKKINSYHYATKHGAGNDGGRLCWDCHDAHGDGNLKMVGKTVVKDSNDSWSLSATRTTPVTFTSNATAAGFVSQGTGITATGICNVCHATAGHYKSTSGDGHGTTGVCTSCHAHSQAAATDAFKNAGGGGDCRGCHGLSTQGSRRAVEADFSKQSHHVGNGGTMGGTLSNFDCVVCHAEGKIVAGATDTAGQPHMDGKIDLRNVDSTTAYFTYDKDAVETSAGAAANWHSGNSVWRTQTSTALDPFCLSCHDVNGASQYLTLAEAGATAANPFKDTTVTNNYDQASRGGVVDIKTKVMSGVAMYSRHAIRNTSGQTTMAPSVYTKYQGLGGTYQSMYEWGSFVTTMGTDENGKPNWNDTSVMGCADCHTTDGANGSTGNAHGSPSEYLLKDSTGGASEGTLTGKNYVCYRCHSLGKYDTGMTHAPNGSDYQDTTSQVGTLRVSSGKGGTIFGNACMNCHGGAGGFGWIHGTNQSFGTGANGAGTARNAYRFTNGASLRYYQPATNWVGAGSCFTLSTADSWGGCTQHNRSSATGLTVPSRPLSY